MEEADVDVSRREKVDAILDAAEHDPRLTGLVVALGTVTAVLEGVGLTFILPIIELVQSGNPSEQADGIMAVFITAYRTVGIPFTLGTAIFGVALVMCLRYISSFLLRWLRGILQFSYERDLRERLFSRALGARVDFIDREGSDNILNALVTESKMASRVLKRVVLMFELVLLTAVYALIALWIAPLLTILAVGILGGISLLLRRTLRSGYDVGDRVADANERLQQIAQAGMIGIRDIRIFNLESEVLDNYTDTLENYTDSNVKLTRNKAAHSEIHRLVVAVSVFVLIYLALAFANLSVGELGLFLFVMFRLGPRVSSLNERFYSIEENLPHNVRTKKLASGLERYNELQSGTQSVPNEVETIRFEDVSFSYTADETVIRGIDFTVEKGEFVGFVGQSGVGKSTIVSLLARFYEPDRGQIRANGEPISEMDPGGWRERVAIVRQSPYIFNDTLRYNLTIGNREAPHEQVERVCEIAKVTEFLDDLPNGYDSELGDEGVRLSGGQKQRVALARALLKDADLLILDEATSDLDSDLEQQVQRAIESMDRDYAIIAIAHRLSTVENADRIYTMEDGRISERGDHGDLVDSDGVYANLYAIQSNG